MKRRLLFIIIAFSISFLIMGALSLVSIERLNTYIAYSDLMDHSGFVLDKIFSVEKGIRDIDRTERGYMITHDTMYIRLLHNSIDSIHRNIERLRKLTIDNNEFQKNINSFDTAIKSRITAVNANLTYVDTSKSSTLSKFYFLSRQQMLDCSRLLKKMHDSENELKADRYKSELIYADLTTKTIKWLLFVFCIITLFLFTLMLKELGGRMRYQDELQAKVIDLKRSHNELQEIAYVASHDLQEPLRKIQVFSNMLLYLKTDLKNAEFRETLTRINSSAFRLQSLINDLMSLTSLTNTNEPKKATNIHRMLQFIISDFEIRINELGAQITVNQLPQIMGYEHQLKILFNALLDNAMKFTKAGVSPYISIVAENLTGKDLQEINPNLQGKRFNCIIVSDNGIGFDQEFIAKMFQIFQRLHTTDYDYDGKGIGLAICQRVMANHEGYIVAESTPDLGASFKLYFPVEE